MAAGGDQRGNRLDRELSYSTEIQELTLQLDAALRDARKIEQIVDEPTQLRHLSPEQLSDQTRRFTGHRGVSQKVARILYCRQRVA